MAAAWPDGARPASLRLEACVCASSEMWARWQTGRPVGCKCLHEPGKLNELPVRQEREALKRERA